MNIIIYYLSKKIILQTKTQHTDNQNIKFIDSLTKTQILDIFESFIVSEIDLLTFESDSIDKGFDKLKKTFKLIYAAGGLIENNNKYLFIFRLKKLSEKHKS